MHIYLYSKCSTCRKALQFLEKNNIPVTVKEITKTPPSLEELQAMLKYQHGNVKKLFNSSGQLYKEMQLGNKLIKMPDREALALLSQHGMLVKRPFLIGKEIGLLGFNEAVWSKSLILADS